MSKCSGGALFLRSEKGDERGRKEIVIMKVR